MTLIVGALTTAEGPRYLLIEAMPEDLVEWERAGFPTVEMMLASFGLTLDSVSRSGCNGQ